MGIPIYILSLDQIITLCKVRLECNSTSFRVDFDSNLGARIGTAPLRAEINSRPGIEKKKY